jgi:putative membrane protein
VPQWAERIKNTVFPITYRLYLHFSIYVFLFSLTMSITDLHSLMEIPLMMIISLPFFLLESTSLHMQDPFNNKPTDAAMTVIARNIEINIRQTLGESNLPEPHQSDNFYLM